MGAKADSNDRLMKTDGPGVRRGDLMRLEEMYIEGFRVINNPHSLG